MYKYIDQVLLIENKCGPSNLYGFLTKLNKVYFINDIMVVIDALPLKHPNPIGYIVLALKDRPTKKNKKFKLGNIF